MRRWVLYTVAALALPATPAFATDHLLFGPAQAWVVPVASPPPPAATGGDSSAFTILLDNEQASLEKGKRRFFSESVYRIDSPQGLDDGNITITWDPATDEVTVHKLLIRRGDQVIDVLKSGQTFTTIRRETNLEAGMLDGQLTATLLPEGLQVGDIVELACTYTHVDPVTKDAVEIEVASFNGSPIGRGYARVSWPSSMPLTFHTTGGLPQPKVVRKGDLSIIEYDMKDIEPLVLPEHAPGRFRAGRGLDASNFGSWADVAVLMKPYFDAASVIPASGPLRDEVEKIRKLPGGPKAQVGAALKLVEDGVRYVALNMGAGGYIPANAETTWSRRFGDCKAKTALLLGILRELHVDAEPVLANTDGNDGLDQQQPELGWFNHVLVRAHVAGQTYWLDGTRSGDSNIDRLEIPPFDWGLPLIARSAPVRMMPEPLKQPSIDTVLSIDAREGINLPAPTTLVYTFRGETARQANLTYNSKPPSQRDKFLRDFFKSAIDDWKTSVISLDPDKVSSAYDPATGEMRLTLVGKAKLDWSDSNLFIEFSALAYKPKFERTEGINRTAPIAMDYPAYGRQVESIRLPKAFLDSPKKIADVNTTLAGVEYHRHAGFTGDAFVVETSERSIAPEVPYADAIAAAPRLRELNSTSYLSLNVPDSYQASQKELAARMTEKPTSVAQFLDRGVTLLDSGRYDEAIADFSSAIALDKTKGIAYADRALAYLWKGDKVHARADLDAAAAIDPKEPVVLRGRGLLAERDSKWQEAVDAYTASLAKDPGNSFALGHRAIAYGTLNREDDALTDAAAALEKQPDWTGLRTMRDQILLKRHQCDDVLKDAQALVERADSDQDNLVTAARLYVLCKHRPEGFATFDKALAVKPSALIYINRANSRLPDDKAGRLADFDAAIKLEPKEAQWPAMKADEIDRQGDTAQALKLYEQALAIEPDNFSVSVKRAVLLHRVGRTDEASKLFTLLRTRATDAAKLNNLCWEKATAGIMLDSALADCNEALKLKPESAAILDSLGMALLRLGRYDDAIKAYDKAIAGGTGAISLMGRAIAHAQKGEKALADVDRKAALSDDPDILARVQRFGLKI
jgi:tetratricopeptide (TPR) repeat protein